MSTDVRYPTGKFIEPPNWDADDIARWRGDVAAHPALLRRVVAGLGDRQLDTSYRDAGWTVRQVVHHLVDSHVNAYCRFKLTLTEDTPTIKPYAEARWAALADSVTGPIEPSLAILEGLHARWSRLLESLKSDDWHRGFIHPEHGTTFTLGRTLAMYAWHGKHHVAHIAALRTRMEW